MPERPALHKLSRAERGSRKRARPRANTTRQRRSIGQGSWPRSARLPGGTRLMIEKDVIVTTKYGPMPSFAVCPDQPGTFPGIIFYMDAPGIREELRNMCRRIAKHGYFCLLPDLDYRVGTLRFDIPRRNDAMSVVIRGAMQSLTNAAIVEDTGGMIAFLDGQDKVAPGPLGCVGHCMSGSFVVSVAAR